MDNSIIEKIYKETFAGCSFFYRDTTLNQDFILKYKVNQIINERGLTDMSFTGGGLGGNLRFLIVSSKGKNVASINSESKKYGHVILQANSFFKVLDIYRIEDKTQILLLNISKEAISLFAKSTSNIEEQIIEKARESFATKINNLLIKDVDSDAWKKRRSHPLGMTNEGDLSY